LKTSKAELQRPVACRPARRARGFTLLELVIAVTLLAAFILPILYIITEAKVRAIKYTQARQVHELAQRKLYDRIHYYEVEDAGTFEREGRPSWTWEILPPATRSGGMGQQSVQVLIEYTIRVTVPFSLDAGGASAAGGLLAASSPRGGSTYEYTLWSFPDERWYEEQQYLFESGRMSALYGDPALYGGSLQGGSY
jgi:prepilin-type N-terminal cleavage/methylation domain-containing protein